MEQAGNISPAHKASLLGLSSPSLTWGAQKQAEMFLFIYIYNDTIVGNALINIPISFNALSLLQVLFHCLWIPIFAESAV